MKLYQLLENTEYFDGELTTEYEEFSCSLVWDGDIKLTKYAMKKFDEVLNSKVTYHDEYNIEIDCGNYEMVGQFLEELAGYVGIEEYELMFREKEE